MIAKFDSKRVPLVYVAFLAVALLGIFASLARADDQTDSPGLSVGDPKSSDTQSLLQPETSAARFQTTYVWQRKPAFGAPYTGTNSLLPEVEKRSYTLSATSFLGTRTWDGGEIYFNPEVISSQSLSGLHGLGGLTNGENQKGGGPNPIVYLARLFIRHTWNLGSNTEQVESAPNQMAGMASKERMVMTVGKVSLLDIFDGSAFAHDPRTQFLNWSLIAHGAFDYAADQRGYTVGAALEYHNADWTFRAGRFAQPIESNGLPLDSKIFAHYGDQVEVERGYDLWGQPGRLRALAFRNKARMGSFKDATDAWNSSGRIGVPNVADVHKEQVKVGFGVGGEQNVAKHVALFARASANDGGTETYAFTEIERSLSVGLNLAGALWQRPEDNIGVAYVRNGLSEAHRQYLAAGGLGVFVGDGSINYKPEAIVEAYYRLAVIKDTSLSLNFQHVANPAYNADRGPARFLGVRIHAEF